MAIKTFIYPAYKNTAGTPLSKVTDLMGTLNTALANYLKEMKVKDPQGIRLPGMEKATKLIAEGKNAIKGTKADLTVRGGLDDKGHLVITVNGILPGPKKFDKTAVVREKFAKVVQEMLTAKNAVINAEKGDDTIDNAIKNQEKKYGTKAQDSDNVDLSGIKSGDVVISAHGGAEAVSGTVIGKSLGGKSPEQIVDILTKNSDKKKRLSKSFSGTVMLTGCFTAAGSGVVPKGYDYSTFAGKVHQLLRSRGYKKCNVKGMPGPSKTLVGAGTVGGQDVEQGDESARHAMLSRRGAEAIKQKIAPYQKAWEDLVAKCGGDKEKAKKNPIYQKIVAKVRPIQEEYLKIENEQTTDDINNAHIGKFFGTFGLKTR